MGQTLTHGVYLPDEGERNCYNGLAANWQILDGSVGTIAAHAAALAGKAPAVHTHTKSDITDFPAYGTTAGTICEGNDSRLSDARTPVAHTHTKSDVTDLLNSNFIPSANNSYDLGSASKQWLNTYSKNYYYNGVAWGLDKANIWTENNSYRKDVILSNSAIQVGVAPTTGRSSYLYFNDNYGSTIGYLRDRVYTSGETQMHLSVHNKYSNGALDVNGSDVQGDLYLGIKSNGTTFMSVNSNSVIPTTTSVTDLGTSTNKWKTLNGINPGALSLPDFATTWEDTTGYILDGTTANLLPLTGNFANPGWICFRVTHTIGTESFITVEQAYRLWAASDKDCITTYTLWIPCKEGSSFTVKCKADSLQVRFHPCQGNV